MKDVEYWTELRRRVREIWRWDDAFRISCEELAANIQDPETANDAWCVLARAAGMHGDLTRARTYLQGTVDSYEKVEALTQVGFHEIQGGRTGQSLLSEAESIVDANAGSWGVPWQLADLLGGIAKAYYQAGLVQEALLRWERAVRIAQQGQHAADPIDSLDSSSVLADLAIQMAQAGALERANGVTALIKNDGKRARAVETISRITTGGAGV